MFFSTKTSFESVNAWDLLKYLILLQSTLIVLFCNLLLETCLWVQMTRWFTPSQSMRDCKIKCREADEWVGIERLTYKGVYYALFETF